MYSKAYYVGFVKLKTYIGTNPEIEKIISAFHKKNSITLNKIYGTAVFVLRNPVDRLFFFKLSEGEYFCFD